MVDGPSTATEKLGGVRAPGGAMEPGRYRHGGGDEASHGVNIELPCIPQPGAIVEDWQEHMLQLGRKDAGMEPEVSVQAGLHRRVDQNLQAQALDAKLPRPSLPPCWRHAEPWAIQSLSEVRTGRLISPSVQGYRR